MTADAVLYLAQFAAATVFALVCEFVFKRRYEPGYTWAPAMAGIAQVGLLVAARLAWAPLPNLEGAALVWWVWWLIFWSFVASAVPVVFWQVVLQDRRWKRASEAWERWNSRNG